jgi:uncharacterized protein (DUF433 family)
MSTDHASFIWVLKQVSDMTKAQQSWQDHIVEDPEILVGKPTIKGTRISVELVLHHLAQNPDLNELFAAYPRLTIDDVKACLAFAGDLVESRRIRKRVKASSTHQAA